MCILTAPESWRGELSRRSWQWVALDEVLDEEEVLDESWGWMGFQQAAVRKGVSLNKGRRQGQEFSVVCFLGAFSLKALSL